MSHHAKQSSGISCRVFLLTIMWASLTLGLKWTHRKIIDSVGASFSILLKSKVLSTTLLLKDKTINLTTFKEVHHRAAEGQRWDAQSSRISLYTGKWG